MPRVTVSIPDELLQEIEDREADNAEYSSRSDAIRGLLRDGLEAESLRQDLEIERNRKEELQRRLIERDDVAERVDVLARRLEDREKAADAPFIVRWGRWARRALSG